MRTALVTIALTALALGLAAAVGPPGGEAAVTRCAIPRGGEPVTLDPAGFTTRIDNPFWPLRPGSRWVYRETDPGGGVGRVVVTATARTKEIANGVTARVVRDVSSENGVPVEVTEDWYAQDRCGNVWYFGEATKAYEHGRVVSTEGSFEAGVDGAQPGVVVPARPRPGLRYREEHYAGHAEDRGEVLSLAEQVQVPFGYFRRGTVVLAKDLNALEPRSLEYKFYARGVGPVLTLDVSGGDEREELIGYRRG